MRPGPPKVMTEWIRLVATPEDKRLLDALTQHYHDAGFSTTVRRLIRADARRLGIEGAQASANSQAHQVVER